MEYVMPEEDDPEISPEVLDYVIDLINEYGDRASDYLDRFLLKKSDSIDENLRSVITMALFNIVKVFKVLQIIAEEYYLYKNIRYRLDRDIMTVLIYLIVFKLKTTTVKCVLKALLHFHPLKSYHLVQFLSREHSLTCIALASNTVFDVEYVKSNILKGDFKDSLKQLYGELRKYFYRKQKRGRELTKPVEMEVLKHKSKKVPAVSLNRPVKENIVFKATSVPKTTYAIPEEAKNLQTLRQFNRVKAEHLLRSSRKNEFKCAKNPLVKSNRFQKTIKAIEEERKIKTFVSSPIYSNFRTVSLPVKVNTAMELREAAKFVKDEEEMIKKLEMMTVGGGDFEMYDKFLFDLQKEREQEALADIEKKHHKGLLSREEALLARQKYLQEMKDRRKRFEMEKEELNLKLEEMRQMEQIKLKEQLEKCQNIKNCAKTAKKGLLAERKKAVKNAIKESKELLEEASKAREEQLMRKIEIIKQIRTLRSIKEYRIKEFDPTLSSGIGSFCEMSLAELKERLFLLKIDLQDELKERQERIKQQREEKRQRLIQVKKYIEEQRKLKKQNVKEKKQIEMPRDPELEMLKLQLQQKREMRIKASSNKI